MRLFVALWPSALVTAALGAIPRPPIPSVRWTSPEQWHVTLRFLGDVDGQDVPDLVDALRPAGRLASRWAMLGPATVRLGPGVLMVPVTGVDDLADAAAGLTRSFGAPPDERPFTGHVTLARSRDRAAIPGELVGHRVEAGWTVDELALVRSHLGTGGARYETIATVALQG
jgi:2'-5' RNA ligase